MWSGSERLSERPQGTRQSPRHAVPGGRPGGWALHPHHPQLPTRVPQRGSWGSGHSRPVLLSRSWEPHTGRGSGHGMSPLQRLTSRPPSPPALGSGLLPGEAFWTFLEPVEIPDYGEASLVREEPWNSASPSGDRLASRWEWCMCAWGSPRTAFHPPSHDQPGSLHPLVPSHSTYCPGLLVWTVQVQVCSL